MAAPEIAPGVDATGTEAEESARRSKKRRSADRDGRTTSTDEENPGSKQTSYECRFCFMRFQKSQALGGHMNRHRQEREKEQYQHAQQLVSSMAQQQMPRTWTSLAAAAAASELTQSPSGPGSAPSRLSSQLTAATRPQPFPPQISFTSYRAPAPTSGSNPSVPSSPSSNYYLPSNSSSSNLQNLQWSVDGFPNAAAPPRSAPFNAVDTTSTPLQAPGVASHVRDHEFLAGVLRATAPNDNNNSNNNNNSSLVSSSTVPTGTTLLPYDLYNSYFGGL